MEEQGESYFFPFCYRKYNFCLFFVKQPLIQYLFRGDYFIRHLLVFRQSFDKFQNKRHILSDRLSKRNFFHNSSLYPFYIFYNNSQSFGQLRGLVQIHHCAF